MGDASRETALIDPGFHPSSSPLSFLLFVPRVVSPAPVREVKSHSEVAAGRITAPIGASQGTRSVPESEPRRTSLPTHSAIRNRPLS